MFAGITPVLLFAAFLLLLLVSLSVPIIKTIDLFKLSATFSEGFGPVSVNANGNVRYGVWGYCISAIQATAAGHSFDEPGQCSKPRLGFTIDSTVAQALHAQGIENDISRAVTAVLVLHPIACGLAFLAFLFSLAMLSRPSLRERACSALTLAMTVIAAILTTIVFLIDVIAVAVARHKIKNASDGEVTATWGSGTWMTLAATVLLWLACFGACCGIFAFGGRRKRSATY